MKRMSTYVASLALIAVAGAAQAATIKVTEGVRDKIAGSTAISDVFAPGGAAGYDFGDLDSNTIELYGRVTSAQDLYTFDFTTSSTFEVSFLFGGYDLANGGAVSESGWTGDDGKDAIFSLLDGVGATITSQTFTTDYTSGVALIFSGGPGDYSLLIDGQGNSEGLYDVGISAVPLPASALLLVGGLAALGGLARRRKG